MMWLLLFLCLSVLLLGFTLLGLAMFGVYNLWLQWAMWK